MDLKLEHSKKLDTVKVCRIHYKSLFSHNIHNVARGMWVWVVTAGSESISKRGDECAVEVEWLINERLIWTC